MINEKFTEEPKKKRMNKKEIKLNIPLFSNDDPNKLFNKLEKIGKGAYGEVFKALSKRDNQIIAIKIINVTDDEAINDVKQEIQMLYDCDHANIVKYHGCYVNDSMMWVFFSKKNSNIQFIPLDCHGILRRWIS